MDLLMAWESWWRSGGRWRSGWFDNKQPNILYLYRNGQLAFTVRPKWERLEA